MHPFHKATAIILQEDIWVSAKTGNSGSGLGYCDLVSSIKSWPNQMRLPAGRQGIRNADCGIDNKQVNELLDVGL
jgi:hypothetical protein